MEYSFSEVDVEAARVAAMDAEDSLSEVVGDVEVDVAVDAVEAAEDAVAAAAETYDSK